MTKKETVIKFIEENIKSGKYRPGDRIMSEYMISEYMKISRMTVRQGVDYLINKGVLYSVRGSGIYVAKKEKGRYIIISFNERILKNQNSSIYLKIMECLKEKITAEGYEPYLYLEKTGSDTDVILKTIDIDIKNVAGIIGIGGNDIYYVPLAEIGVSCVNIMSYKYNYFPSVNIYQCDIVNKICSIAEKFRKPIMFNFCLWKLIQKNSEYFETLGKNEYLKSLYTVYELNILDSQENICKSIDEYIGRIDYEPDLIVFLDDNIYKCALPLFPKYDLFRKAKILTHSNGDEIYPEHYDICRIEYRKEDFAETALRLLLKQIRGEKLFCVGEKINFRVINEELLYK